METALEIVQNPIRIDRNYALRVLDFSCYGKENEDLCRDLVLFFLLRAQRFPMAPEMFTAKEFADAMEHTKKNLQIRHPEPVILTNKTLQKSLKTSQPNLLGENMPELYTSYLENAIMLLGTQQLVFQSPVTVSKGRARQQISFYQVLEGFEIIWDIKQPQKRIYRYKYNKELFNNLSNYYIHVDLERYSKLRKSRLQKAYLFFQNERTRIAYQLKSENNQQGITTAFSFDLLKEIFDVHIVDNKDAKKHIQQKAERLFEFCNWNIDLKFTQTGQQRFAYTGLVTIFPDSNLKLDNLHSHIPLILKETFLLKCSTAFYRASTLSPEESKLAFCTYLFDEKNRQELYLHFIDAKDAAFGKPHDPHDMRNEHEFTGFLEAVQASFTTSWITA